MLKEIAQMVISITIQSLSKVKDVENLVSSVEDLMNFWIWKLKLIKGFVQKKSFTWKKLHLKKAPSLPVAQIFKSSKRFRISWRMDMKFETKDHAPCITQ